MYRISENERWGSILVVDGNQVVRLPSRFRELLAELAAVDYWRLAKGLEYELKYLTKQGGEFHPPGGMPTLVRYDGALPQLRQEPATADAEAAAKQAGLRILFARLNVDRRNGRGAVRSAQ